LAPNDLCMVEIVGYVKSSGLCGGCFCNNNQRKRKVIKYKLLSPELAQQCVIEIEKLIHNTSRGEYLVIVNPVSGTKRGLQVYKNEVIPLLHDASVIYSTYVTSEPKDASSFMRHHPNLASIDTILCIGGDGTLHEILQGIYDRDDAAKLLQHLKFMPIPGGTANGLCKSITFEANEECSALTCTFLSLKGKPSALDMTEVWSQATKETSHAFLMLGWGLVADVDILSETMRYLGEMRLYVSAVWHILLSRTYKGKLTIIPYEDTDSNLNLKQSKLPQFDGAFEIDGARTPEVVHEGEFTLIWVVQTSHCAESMYSGPDSRIGSGHFTIYWVEKVGRCDMLSLLLQIDNGGHANNDKVRSRRAIAYRIEPDEIENNEKQGGFYTLDGELIPAGGIQGIIRPQICNVSK